MTLPKLEDFCEKCRSMAEIYEKKIAGYQTTLREIKAIVTAPGETSAEEASAK